MARFFGVAIDPACAVPHLEAIKAFPMTSCKVLVRLRDQGAVGGGDEKFDGLYVALPHQEAAHGR